MTTATARPLLARPRRVVLGGVCAGLATHLEWPVGRIRFLMVALSLLGGAGILLYAWLWVLTPLAPAVEKTAANEATADKVSDETDDSSVRRHFPAAGVLLAIAAVAAIGAIVLEPSSDVGINPGIIATVLFAGASVAWSLALDRRDPGRSSRSGLIIRSFSAVLLIVTGLSLLFSFGGRPRAITAVGAVVLVVAGVGVVVAPVLVRLWTDLMTERSARVRETERAEIAAHLHDSVLQTLALIQVRAGASSEVARLARAQERELRDWLFAGTTPSGSDLATEIRDAAAAIELDYPARIELVVVGEPEGTANPTLVAATREAMVNAARHAGGDIAVYLEVSPEATDVFVRDRGPGFDLDAQPSDRLGVRESIIGRMLRAGGSATVSRGAGGSGTEVHLHLETPVPS
ncbi:ATP-binding protein [soil metagenome]